MARKKAKYTFGGSKCSGTCSGHSAGYDYAAAGGSTYSKYSPSFNNGMRIAQGLKPLSPKKQTGLRITVGKKR